MKSPEEIKKGLECCSISYADCNNECPYKPDCDGSQILKDAIAYIQQLEAQVPRWISVEERMPEKGQKVAFIPNCNPRSVYVGEISHAGKQGGVMFKNSFSRTTMNYYATHWMPLPEAPEMKEETP